MRAILICLGIVVGAAVFCPAAGAAPAPDAQKPSAPRSFRGLVFGSILPPTPDLISTSLAGCSSIVEDAAAGKCLHRYVPDGDLDIYTQTNPTDTIFGISVDSKQLVWKYHKFWSGTAFIHKCANSYADQIRLGLMKMFGSPTLDQQLTDTYATHWEWPEQHIMVSLSVRPQETNSRDCIALEIGSTDPGSPSSARAESNNHSSEGSSQSSDAANNSRRTNYRWYEAEFCDPSYCSFYKCEKLSEWSPAEVYENNQRYADDKIVPGEGGRVDVLAQRSRWVWFDSREACKSFSDAEYQAAHDAADAEKRKLDPYR